MATAHTIISRALRLCRVIDAHAPMDANTAQDALDVLNAMLAEWHEAGVGLPDYRFASLEDALDSDAADAEAIAYQLAIRVNPEYGTAFAQGFAEIADESFRRLRMRYFQPGNPSSDLPGVRRAYDVEAG